MVMILLFVIQDQWYPNRVIIIRFVRRAHANRWRRRRQRSKGPCGWGRKKGKRIVNEGIILLGPTTTTTTGSRFSFETLHRVFDVSIKIYVQSYTPARDTGIQECLRNTREMMATNPLAFVLKCRKMSALFRAKACL